MLSIALMAIDHRQHHLENLRASLSVLIYPLQYIVSLPVETGDWMKETFASRETLVEDNARLRMQETLLKAQLQKFTALKTENQRLRGLLQSSDKLGERILIAELLAVDMDPFTRQIVINKGSRDGVFLGQPLLAAEGVMGQVIHVGPFSANAMLITDPNHAIPVQVDRTGLRGIAIGTGSADHMEVPYLPLSADIVEGDLLISSGLGGRFPPDYPVATVTKVKKIAGQPYTRVEVKPTALLDHSREVLLVWIEQPGAGDASAQTPTPEQPAPASAGEGAAQ